ncbi:MAG: hypothetical protein SFX73_10605 [Kofleriaceae bacterium]|nr:hypothetical protein [Kofleriaceae bacterium]
MLLLVVAFWFRVVYLALAHGGLRTRVFLGVFHGLWAMTVVQSLLMAQSRESLTTLQAFTLWLWWTIVGFPRTALVCGSGALAITLTVAWAHARTSRTWRASYGGHVIELHNAWTSEMLVVDGRVVDRQRGSRTLSGEWTLADGTRRRVHAQLVTTKSPSRPLLGHIFVDGQWVGGDALA